MRDRTGTTTLPLKLVLIALIVAAGMLLATPLTAAPRQAPPCENDPPAEACVDIRLSPETLIGDIFVDEQQVAGGVNTARINVPPNTTARVEARNVRDGSQDFGDLYIYNEPGANLWTPAGQIYRYTLYPGKVFIKGELNFTCDIRNASEGENVACRVNIDGQGKPDVKPGEAATYRLEAGQHNVLVRVVGQHADLWDPDQREDTVNVWAGGTSYLRSRFDKKGLLTVNLNQEGVRGDYYINGEVVAQGAPGFQQWVEPYTSLRVEAKNLRGPDNSEWRDTSASAYLGPGQEQTLTLRTSSITPVHQTQTQTQPQQQQTQPATTSSVPAGAASGGGFELGGQVRGGEFYGNMHSAGMTWVKFQVRGLDNVGGIQAAVNEGHANGFKVLVSVLGDHHIDFNAWANYLGAAAAAGPDAIEVWNEPNFSREWPAEHMGGDQYVHLLLAPSYHAIKSANPNVMVVSGAPTPTGVFQGCSFQEWIPMTGCDDNHWINQVAAAGGAGVMDCVGVHYNAGATSPYANSGHPAGSHYSWYMGGMLGVYRRVGRPLCFTEFGYAVGPGLPSTFAWANDNTVDEQAQWLADAAVLARRSGVRLMIVWNVGGYGGGGGDPQGAYSIVRGGSCPACETLGRVMGVR